MKPNIQKIGRGLAVGAAAAAAGYAGVVAWNRLRYGHVTLETDPARASLLDHFIPKPEIIAGHDIAVAAPPETVLDAARNLRMLDSPPVRALFKLRELALGGEADTRPHPEPLLEQLRSIGWVVLAETPGREIVFGAVTKPWLASPAFRSIPAAGFAAFAEPDYVKIAFSLRADPDDAGGSVFRTETRAIATDEEARAKFRRYWSYVAPGVHLIRLAMLQPVKTEAERRVYATVA